MMEELSNQTGTAGGHERPATRAARSAPPDRHLAPSVGLLNDPNGFIQHNGVYHLFYQWNPLGCDHRNKCWGHWQSIDLVHWEHQPLAPAPGACYDSHGCYSGSAVVAEDKVTLIYTGNVKFPDGSRTAYQCPAQASDRGEYRKLGPVLPLPEGYSGHVRDPKVWRHQDAGTWCSARVTCRIAARCCCCAPAICATGKRWERSPVPA